MDTQPLQLAGLDVHVVPAFFDNYLYVLAWDGQAVAVDPADSERALGLLKKEGLALRAVLNTHDHQDHVAGNEAVKAETGCRVVGPDDDRIPAIDQRVAAGDFVEAGPAVLEVLETPGHGTRDISFLLKSSREEEAVAVFCGDTLFGGGCGRLLGGSAEDLLASLRALAALPPSARVYFGHEYTEENLRFALSVEPGNRALQERYREVQDVRKRFEPTAPSTIALERATNPFLRTAEPAIRASLGMDKKDDLAVFTELRKRKDRF